MKNKSIHCTHTVCTQIVYNTNKNVYAESYKCVFGPVCADVRGSARIRTPLLQQSIAGSTAENLQQWLCCCEPVGLCWDRQTDGRTMYRFIVPDPHTMRFVPLRRWRHFSAKKTGESATETDIYEAVAELSTGPFRVTRSNPTH